MSKETFAGEPLDPHAAADEIARLRGEVERLTRERDDAKEQLRGTEAASALQGYGVDTHAMLQAGLKTARELAIKFMAERDAALARAEAAERKRDSVKEELANIYANDLTALERAEAAEAKVAKLRGALKPFAEALDGNYAEQEEDHVDLWESGAATVVTYGDLRRARTALQEIEE